MYFSFTIKNLPPLLALCMVSFCLNANDVKVMCEKMMADSGWSTVMRTQDMFNTQPSVKKNALLAIDSNFTERQKCDLLITAYSNYISQNSGKYDISHPHSKDYYLNECARNNSVAIKEIRDDFYRTRKIVNQCNLTMYD